MYGEELVDIVLKSLTGEIKFYGLTPTNMDLDGIDKHKNLINSYKKLQKARKNHVISDR